MIHGDVTGAHVAARSSLCAAVPPTPRWHVACFTSGVNLQARRTRMQVKAKLFGHPIHQMLVVFPLGLLATSLVFDFIYKGTGNGRWGYIAFAMITCGIIGGLLAAVFGFIDWLGIPSGTRAKRIGAFHGIGNVAVVGLFAVSWLIRYDVPIAPEPIAIVLSGIAVGLALVTGWLGGELVDRLAVGVDEGAHVDAPSSLSDRPAHEHARRGTTTAPRPLMR